MAKKEKTHRIIKKKIKYIPLRYILAMLIILFEIIAIMLIVIGLTINLPYFYIAAVITQAFCVLLIANSSDNPDYKVPWLLVVLIIPVIGFMLYFMFYSRKFSKKQIRKLEKLKNAAVNVNDEIALNELKKTNEVAYASSIILKKLADSHLYQNTNFKYFSTGEAYYNNLLEDLKKAEKFIFMEYFIIEEGLFWNSILEILKEKVKNQVEIKIVYDDIGCMKTLPGNYYKTLTKLGIKTVPFSKLRGQANNEFNNRSHRKITVIDGIIGYTGGINIADEYINKIEKFGYWKDVGIRMEGEAVVELTRLFLMDFYINDKKPQYEFAPYYNLKKGESKSFCVPFGDGPNPVYKKRVAKTLILNMLNQAKKLVYITTPYLIIDNEIVQALENASLRGVDVRIITPHIPDKKIVFMITRSYYASLIDAGVKIYEYRPGFIHAKTYIVDDEYAMIGTINLDYRSLVHHFENGVWIFNDEAILEMKSDFLKTQEESIWFKKDMIKNNALQKLLKAIVKIFSPLL